MFCSSSDRTACKGLAVSSIRLSNGVRKWSVVFLAAVTFILGSWLLSPVVSARLGVPSGKAEGTKSKQRAGGYESNRKLDETRLQESYSKLPLSFEPNVGQTDGRVKYLARGRGYGLFLTNTEAVLLLKNTEKKEQPDTQSEGSVFKLSLKGGNPRARISGEEELPGKANYFVGKQKDWRKHIPTFSRVRYRGVYPGIDLVYYGNQSLLEYDFVVSPRSNPDLIRLRVDGVTDLTINESGDLVLGSGDERLRFKSPVTYQVVNGERRQVTSRYRLISRNEIGFEVGHYDRTQTLIIDPVLVYSTFLGGPATDTGNAIAVDSAGNAYLTGETSSTVFPRVTPYQFEIKGANDAFIIKIDPSGTQFVYSTYLGGHGGDEGTSIAVDNEGYVYIAGQSGSSDFPTLPTQPDHVSAVDAFIVKLNQNGNALVYSRLLGGSGFDTGTGMALDANGSVYLAGTTNSRDFPAHNGFQTSLSGHNLHKSINRGAAWASIDSGITGSAISSLVSDLASGTILYASTDLGAFKSTDGGNSWIRTSKGLGFPVKSITIDPTSPSTLYAATNAGFFKSTDGAANWAAINFGLSDPKFGQDIAVDPQNPSVLYACISGPTGLYKSTNGGASWTRSANGIVSFVSVTSLAVDPSNSSTVYAGTSQGVYKSTDAGASWGASSSGFLPTRSVTRLYIDTNSPSTIFAFAGGTLLRSVNSGANWVNISGPFAFTQNTFAVDPSNSQTIYLTNSFGEVRKTVDGGVNWTTAGNVGANVAALLVDHSNSAILYSGSLLGTDAYVAKLNPSGSDFEFVSLLGGNKDDIANGIAVDSQGTSYVVGQTSSTDFPLANPMQSQFGGQLDAFVTKFDATGKTLAYSTYLGGDQFELARAIAVDTDNRAVVIGYTASANFPLKNAFQSEKRGFQFSTDAFITKLDPSGSSLAFSTYLGGENSDEAFDVAIDDAGNIYVTGGAGSNDFPVTNNIGQNPSDRVSPDTFVAKMSSSGQSLPFSVLLGGNNFDFGTGIALGSDGSIYVIGNTRSTSFPLNNPLQETNLGDSDAFVAKFVPGVDLSLSITDSPDPVLLGSDLSYSLEVRNKGEIKATGVQFNATLPAGATLISSFTSQGTCNGAACALGEIEPGASVKLTVVTKPPAQTSVTFTASVSSDSTDGDLSNNTATASTNVTFADLELKTSATNDKVDPGGRAGYFLTLKNNFGATASDIVISGNLPGGAGFVSCSSSVGTCAASNNKATVNIPVLAAGQSVAVTLFAEIGKGTAVGTDIVSSASVVADTPDSNLANNTASATTKVAAMAAKLKGNGKIAFQSDRAFSNSTQPAGIYMINSDGSGDQQFPGIPINSTAPSWSPDGKKLAYETSTYPGANLTIINADGTAPVTIASIADLYNRTITWSPNGGMLAVIGSDRFIYLVAADGSGMYKLPNGPGNVGDLSWSPDGNRFALEIDKSIYLMNVDGSGLTKLNLPPNTSQGVSDYTSPRWYPDGSKLLFKGTGDYESDLYVIGADGTGFKRLSNYSVADYTVSPDGRSILYSSGYDLYVINYDGSAPKRLTNSIFYDAKPAWQPNPSVTPEPPVEAQTFSISGKISGDLFGASVVLSGDRTATRTPDINGNFTFVNLPAGGTYSVTPKSNFYSYTPTSRTVSNLSADTTGVNFDNAGTIDYTISGHIKESNGTPIAQSEVKLSTSWGFQVATTKTDATGSYVFHNLWFNTPYLVVPTPTSEFDFEPEVGFVTIDGSKTINFTAIKLSLYTIRGRVWDVAKPGTGVPGVAVKLQHPSGNTNSVVTDANGNYAFKDLLSNRWYAVSVDQTFVSPSYQEISKLEADETLHFVKYPVDRTLTIKGRVVDGNGNGISVAIVRLSGAENRTATFPNNGEFQFTGLKPGLEYVVTAFTYGWTIDKPYRVFTDLHADAVMEDFIATPAEPKTTFQFPVARFSTREGATTATITVTRSGDTANSGQVNYRTLNGTASEPGDYTGSTGILNFAPGETTKTFNVAIADDLQVENPERINVLLENPVGGTLNVISAATITIEDNDLTTPTMLAAYMSRGDFDGDGHADTSVWRPASGAWFILSSSTNQGSGRGWGTAEDIPVPADYDGDGKTDLAVWRPSSGAWFIINSSTGQGSGRGWGSEGDIPVPADYDGDGKADLAVWRPASGAWFIMQSSNNQGSGRGWGSQGDVPAPGDYDGDGKADLAVWRPDSGAWFIMQSSNNQGSGRGWGSAGDIPVPGKYDADNKTDLAVYRPSSGAWFIINSSNNQTSGAGWGGPTDIPVPADYDGDGRTDKAVWRPNSGAWFIMQSSTNQGSGRGWGSQGDVPVSSSMSFK